MTSLLLGVRLALSPAARLRSVSTMVAAALATVILLVVTAASRYELDHATSYQTEMPRLVAAAGGAVALPCAVLLATVARLAAALRDRRLANLRLIGLTPAQTRLVASGETGVAAGLGAVVGTVVFAILRPGLASHPVAGQAWDQTWSPGPVGYAAVLAAVPLVVVLVGLLPTRLARGDLVAMARRADRRPPRLWRTLPLLAGVGLCVWVILQRGHHSADVTDQQLYALFAGVPLLGLGLLLVLPVLVRLLTGVLVQRDLGPVARLVTRRLEAQPAGVARIVSALLLGLFLVTGARFVVTAFESTPQYRVAARDVEDGQRVTVRVQQSHVAAQTARLRDSPDVDRVLDVPTISFLRHGLTAAVLDCAQLHALAPQLAGCHTGQPMWLNSVTRDFYRHQEFGPQHRRVTRIRWAAGADRHRRHVLDTPVDLPVVRAAGGDADVALSPLQIDVVMPPRLVADLPADATHLLLVTGPPGRGLSEELRRRGFSVDSYGGTEDYDFVAAMRAVVWSIAAVVLGLGLLTLGIATLDRSIQRRKEVTSLRLVGMGPGLIRWAQWLEAALPIAIGSVAAIALGALAGATYLTIDESLRMPWHQAGTLGIVAVLGAAAVATVATIASAPPLRPDEIRLE